MREGSSIKARVRAGDMGVMMTRAGARVEARTAVDSIGFTSYL
jgi:hypothetical protein